MTHRSLLSWSAAIHAAILTGTMLGMPICAHAQQPNAQAAPPAQPETPPTSDPEALALASLDEAIINHRDGRQIQGEILDEDDHRLFLNLDGIRTEVLRVDINSMRRLAPAIERYRSVRATIDSKDIDSRMALIDWLRHRRLFAEALVEIRVVLAADPANIVASGHQTWLEAQLRLRRVKAQTPEDARDHAESLEIIRTRGARRTEQADLPLLSAEQINRIRVYEVNLDDPPRIMVPAKTIEKLLATYGAQTGMPQTRSGRKALTRQPGHEILDLMFRLRARELYPEVRVLEDPASLKYFRERIHGRGGWLINSCGSVRCHGGTESGPFQLVTKRGHSTEAVYTNFYILDNFRLADGTPLINYEEPARSPLLQLATRRDNTSRPHPPTGADRGPRAWRHLFSSPEDSKYRDAADWIRSLYRPRPDYGIEYAVPDEPPALGQSTEPEGPIEAGAGLDEPADPGQSGEDPGEAEAESAGDPEKDRNPTSPPDG